MANEAQWAELLEPGLREIFEVQRDALAAVSRIPMLFHLGDSIKAHEHFLGAGSMNLWEEYKGSISYDDRVKLENDIRQTHDVDLIKQWDLFVASKNGTDAQSNAITLMSMLTARMI